MLAYLLDEHLSQEVAALVRARRPEIRIESIRHWREGRMMRQSDEAILIAAREEGLTLVTYDQKTVVPLLVRWGLQEVSHSGVVFVDDRTMASNDLRALVRGLIAHWELYHNEDWTNRADYLQAAE
jgi:hypothetical protein